MPVYDRQVGTTQDMVDIFIQDATVSTGFGLPNLQISTFSSYYHRSDMTSTSSVTLVSTGTLGTWSSGQFLQINSTFMRGWYQFCVPNGVFVNGSTAALHMYGHPSMAPLPLIFNITRFNPQRYVSSEPHNIERVYRDALVTTAVGVLAVGPVGVSSFGITVGVSSQQVAVDVTSFYASAAVTTAAGVLAVGRVGVSSFGLPVGVSSFGVAVGVSSISVAVDVSSFYGTAAVTTSAGILATVLDLGRTANSTSTVSFPNLSISSQSVSVGSVDVTSFFGSAVVTTAAGVLAVGRVGVSSFGLPVGVSSFNIAVDVSSFYGSPAVTSAAGVLASHVTSMRIAVDAQIVDRLLNRNVSSGADGGRSVREALYVLRNKVDAGSGVVYETDDTQSSWAFTVSTTATDPIVMIDPS